MIRLFVSYILDNEINTDIIEWSRLETEDDVRKLTTYLEGRKTYTKCGPCGGEKHIHPYIKVISWNWLK